jgi:hypothetical protein
MPTKLAKEDETVSHPLERTPVLFGENKTWAQKKPYYGL